MATLGNANNASEQNTSRRSYIATAPFYAHFFTYTTYLDNITTRGRLTQVAGANCAKCPTGRILRENGRKLYPDANPDITKYLVGVYDSVTFLSGYINPNDSVFAIYNSDRPNYIEDNNDGLEGAPVLTTGNVISTEGFVGVQSTIAEGELYAGAYLDSNGTPIVQAGVNYGGDCQDSALYPSTFATLYPSGTIESITYSNGPTTRVTLTANGNIFNTGNVSTIGDTYVQGTLSTIGLASLGSGVRVGNGQTIARITTGTTTANGTTPANHTFGDKHTVTPSVPLAVIGDTLILNQGADVDDWVMGGYWISGAGTVAVQFICNSTNSNNSVTIPAFRYTLIRNI
jgi:hypothetical protein